MFEGISIIIHWIIAEAIDPISIISILYGIIVLCFFPYDIVGKTEITREDGTTEVRKHAKLRK